MSLVKTGQVQPPRRAQVQAESFVEVAGCRFDRIGNLPCSRSFAGPGSVRKSWEVKFIRASNRHTFNALIWYTGLCQIEMISGHCEYQNSEDSEDQVYKPGTIINAATRYPVVWFTVLDRLSGPYMFSVSFRRKRGCQCTEYAVKPEVTATLTSLSSHLSDLFACQEDSDVVFEFQSVERAKTAQTKKSKKSRAVPVETLEAESREIRAHKLILCARVPYFKSMFDSGMKEAASGRIRIEDAEAEYFERVLRFIYSGQVPEDLAEKPEKYLPIADKYGIEDLKAASSESAKKSLKKENVIATLIMADLHQCADLKAECINHLREWKASMGDAAMDPLALYPQLLLECAKKF